MTDHQVRERILEVLRGKKQPIGMRELVEDLFPIDEWLIKEEIWVLSAAEKVHITWNWKVEIV